MAAAAPEHLTHLILDDGLQNPDLVKDLSLLLIDGGAGFGNGRMIPAGPLRERVESAAARVQAAVLIGADATGAARQLPPGLPVISASLTSVFLHSPGDLAGRRVMGFAGIGRPGKFRASLESAGAEIAGFHPFADHHFYHPAEIAGLIEQAQAAGALLVTTRKDWVRLPEAARERVLAIEVGLEFTPADALAALLCRSATS